MRSRLLIAPLAASIVTLGCATPNSVVYTAVNQTPRALQRVSPESVEIFLGKPPGRPHVEIGLFEVYQGQNDDSSGRSTEDMLQTLRQHAALRGCDAIQVLGVELAGKYLSRVVRAACEIYSDDEGQRAAAAHHPATALPGEGRSCQDSNPSPGLECLDPLVCQKGRCASPYH
jgi:hypothetical protein